MLALALGAGYLVLRAAPATPKLSGTVLLDKVPAAGATVELHFQDPVLSQKDRVVTTRTNARGHFVIGPLAARRHVVAPWDESGTDWRLDFAAGGQRFQGWQNRSLGAPSAAIEVSCDLRDPVKAGTLGTRSAGEGMCRLVGEKD